MKFRQDFVTNSSSTSFIISLKDDWNDSNFFRSIGLLDDSALRSIFENLFRIIDYNKEEITSYIKRYYPKEKSVETFLSNRNYSIDVINKVSELIHNGRTVYFGELSAENGDSVEAFFCMESFLLCDDDIYFNGQISGW